MTDDDGFIDALPADYLEPGETMTVEVEGTPVTLANANGTWCAFEHMCPHQATPLGGLPLMRGANGLPLGVQLVGRRHFDARLLRTARWLVEKVSS